MAQLGFRSFDEMIGESQRLDQRRAIEHYKAKGIDLSRILAKPHAAPGVATHNSERQNHNLENVLDRRLIEQAQPALTGRQPVRIDMPIRNVDRTVGAMLSGKVAKRYGHAGLPEDTIGAYVPRHRRTELRRVSRQGYPPSN